MSYVLTPPLTTRANKGQPLSDPDMDNNLNAIQAAINAFGALFNADGTIDPTFLHSTLVQYLASSFVASTYSFLHPVGTMIYVPVVLQSGVSNPTDGAVWVLCDGSAKNQNDYPKLFAYLQHNMDSLAGPDGPNGSLTPSSQFRVPDGRDLFLLGSGTSQAAMTTGGERTHTLGVSELPSHAHTQSQYYYNQVAGGGSNLLGLTRNDSLVKTGLTTAVQGVDAAGGNGAHNNMPPYLAGYFYILAGYKVGGNWV